MTDLFDTWSLLAAASKLVLYASSLVAVGSLLFAIAMPRVGVAVAGALRRLAIGATLLAIAATVVRVMVQGGRMLDEWAGMTDPDILMISLDGPLGASTGVRLAGLGLLLLAALVRPLRGPATLVGAVLVAGSFALTGHATRAPQWALGGLVTIHLLALAYWVGALAPLYRLAGASDDRRRAAEIAERFGRQASVVVPVLVLAGAGFAYVLLGGLVPLVTAGYGQVLLAKLGLVALVLGIAALNKWRFVPALASGGAEAGFRFRRALALEALAFVAVFAMTAVMTTSFTVPEAA
ncbi:CopD family protein [Stappia sp.]|uniref:CopD family protein n=1 Tax=Stappia sp. TaxID=1870903 RepID=UPI0032D8C01E